MTNKEALAIIENLAENTFDTKLFMALAHAAAALRCVVNTEEHKYEKPWKIEAKREL